MDSQYREMLLPEFLEIHYKQIGKIVEFSPYIAFGLICAGIELLGKCYDTRIKKFNQYAPKFPQQQFKSALVKLFPEEYAKIGIDLYDELRNGLLHSILPKEKVWLRTKASAITGHLEKISIKGTEKLNLIIETFFEDYKCACKVVIYDIKRKDISLNEICFNPVLLV